MRMQCPEYLGCAARHWPLGLRLDSPGKLKPKNAPFPISRQMERWKLLDGGNAIEATVTFDDHGAFNAPWSGLVRWTKLNGPIAESVCAENNENYGKFLGLSKYPMPEAKTPGF